MNCRSEATSSRRRSSNSARNVAGKERWIDLTNKGLAIECRLRQDREEMHALLLLAERLVDRQPEGGHRLRQRRERDGLEAEQRQLCGRMVRRPGGLQLERHDIPVGCGRLCSSAVIALDDEWTAKDIPGGSARPKRTRLHHSRRHLIRRGFTVRCIATRSVSRAFLFDHSNGIHFNQPFYSYIYSTFRSFQDSISLLSLLLFKLDLIAISRLIFAFGCIFPVLMSIGCVKPVKCLAADPFTIS